MLLMGGLFLCVALSANNTLYSSNHKTVSANPAVQWGEMTLSILKNTAKGSPTYNSRSLGYMGLAMYECVVHSSSTKKSQVGQVNGLMELPQPESRKTYNWVLALNAGQSFLLKHLYSHTDKKNIEAIDSLENYILSVEVTNDKVKERSIAFGKAIAIAIYEWSKTDGGYKGYLHNFDSTYQLPVGKGYWKPPTRGQVATQLPLHHFWGRNRTFAPNNLILPVPEMKITFDHDRESEYYKQMNSVRLKNTQLTQEEKEIANWWGDDPSQTFSPPGHSYHLATIAIKISNADLLKASETYARVGMAVADAFINCWKCKYTYHAERPANFIFLNITTLWELYWPEPPFPAFYSGHAAQGSAMATVLSDLYGNNFTFIDDSHVGRPDDSERLVAYKERTFHSFLEAAEESAMSRFYGGIHTHQDNEVGLVEGKKIGNNINSLNWNSK
jgi:hypothetical protein